MSKRKEPKNKLETEESKARFGQLRAKHGLGSKKRHIVTSYLTGDGRIVVRFGPNKLLAVDGDRDDWFAPVGPANSQRAYQSQGSCQEQQEISNRMDEGALAGTKEISVAKTFPTLTRWTPRAPSKQALV